MKSPKTRSAWLSLALILLVVSVPAHDNAARGVLGAFINEVGGMERNGRLTPADAEALVNSAQAIRDGL